ncbi:MAG TPA: glycosyltransferase family 4 protein [Acidobacteriota bacterium]|nr:glycosyltransferase family 4 protein [Acidobacteriota bacterium]
MKLALCHHYSLTFHGGGERFLIEFAKQLRKRGNRVTICALPFGHRDVDISNWLDGIEYHEGFLHDVDDADIAYFVFAPFVLNFFKGDCPKIGAVHAFVFAVELQHAEVQSMNSVNFVRRFGLSRFAANLYFNKIMRRNLTSFDAIHVINRECLNMSLRAKKLYYIPNWIDTSLFKPTTDKDTDFSALFVGRKNKGFSTFAKIARSLKNKDINFFAIGADIESVDNVQSLGFITNAKELIDLYSRVHVIVYTSEIDVFPLTLLEACSCGTPVLALPTKAIEGLDLSIFYAPSTDQFIWKIADLQKMWQRQRDTYSALTEKIRADGMKYDVNRIFPKYLAMLREVSGC